MARSAAAEVAQWHQPLLEGKVVSRQHRPDTGTAVPGSVSVATVTGATGKNWENQRAAYKPHFKNQLVFCLLKSIFSVFLTPLKYQINIRLKKKDNKKQHFSLPVNRTATYAESLPHSPSNPQIQHAAQPPSNRIEHEAVHCLLS